MEWMNHVTCKPSASLGFPAQDFRFSDDGSSVTIEFLSLLGAMSPLPHHLSFGTIDSPAFYAFIACLNRLFYQAFYAAWHAAHHVGLLKIERPSFAPSLLGLRALLSNHCAQATVQVEAGYQKISVSSRMALSDNAILGSRIFVRHAGVKISVEEVLSAQDRQRIINAVQCYVGSTISVRFEMPINRYCLGVPTNSQSSYNLLDHHHHPT